MTRNWKTSPIELRAILAACGLLFIGCAARLIGDLAPETQLPAYWVVVVSGVLAIVLFLVSKTRDMTFGIPFLGIGLLVTVTLAHLGQVLGWQPVVSGPWSTWPAYAWIATFAGPVGAFVDFMVWAGKPRQKGGDQEASTHDGRAVQK